MQGGAQRMRVLCECSGLHCRVPRVHTSVGFHTLCALFKCPASSLIGCRNPGTLSMHMLEGMLVCMPQRSLRQHTLRTSSMLAVVSHLSHPLTWSIHTFLPFWLGTHTPYHTPWRWAVSPKAKAVAVCPWAMAMCPRHMHRSAAVTRMACCHASTGLRLTQTVLAQYQRHLNNIG